MQGNQIGYELLNRLVDEDKFLWQYDYGQYMQLTGVDLPYAYEVHFSNTNRGTSVASLGDENGVAIPDAVLTSGKPVYFWLFIPNSESSGATAYGNIIPVRTRSSLPTEEPTPVQQNEIEQFLAALNDAVADAQALAESIPETINEALQEAKDSGEFRGDPGAVFTPSVDENGIMRWENDGGLLNPDPVNLGTALHLDRYARSEDLAFKIDYSEKGQPYGVANLNGDGKVPDNLLPPYVDDVLEFPSLSQFPNPGESGKLYISTSNNMPYRWAGNQYVVVGPSENINNKADKVTGAVNGDLAALDGNGNLTDSGKKAEDFALKTDTVLNTTLSRGRIAGYVVGEGSFAFGSNVVASNDYGHAEGLGSKAGGNYSHAEGYWSEATNTAGHAENKAKAYGAYSHAEGESTAYGDYSHAEGKGATNNSYAHAEGYNTNASAQNSHAEGSGTTAIGGNSHAEGSGAVAAGSYAHAEGGGTEATGSGSHAEGAGTHANGVSSHAEGGGTYAVGMYSHAEGGGTHANGLCSHSEGSGSVASGTSSHAEGSGTEAGGSNSHVVGAFNVIDSYSYLPEWVAGTSYAVGDEVKVTSTNGIITGYTCKTANSDSTFTSSKWNNKNGQMRYAELVGNGTNVNSRSNARALDWSGNEYLAGDVYVGCNDDSTGGSKLAKVSEVNAKLDAPSTAGTSGQVLTSDGIGGQSWQTPSGGTVTDVQVNGTSVLSNGVANVPIADASTPGVGKADYTLGIGMLNGAFSVSNASDSEIKSAGTTRRPINPSSQHKAVFYGLAKAAGDSTQSSSSNAVGTYTPQAQAAIQNMIGVSAGITLVETVTGTTPSLTCQPNVRYNCGEVSTLSITPPANGTCDVFFTSGSTAAVLTVPNTVKFPASFDTTSLETGTIYEIMITDGVYGTVMTWES